MTVNQFKSHEANRQELAMVLANPTFQAALAALLNEAAGRSEVNFNDPEIVSVRVLEYRNGFEAFPRRLEAMTRPDPLPDQEIPTTWGKDDEFQKLANMQPPQQP